MEIPKILISASPLDLHSIQGIVLPQFSVEPYLQAVTVITVVVDRHPEVEQHLGVSRAEKAANPPDSARTTAFNLLTKHPKVAQGAKKIRDLELG